MMTRKKPVSNLRFNASRDGDRQVVGWVTTLAKHLRRKPQEMARIALEDGCLKIAMENNIDLVSAQPAG
ncbi:hypothetical protein ACQ9LF_06200 [Anaerohalosphaeraceae bacterium U12dextr]|jgi:hypothetical protein